jgi:hypothetical protein
MVRADFTPPRARRPVSPYERENNGKIRRRRRNLCRNWLIWLKVSATLGVANGKIGAAKREPCSQQPEKSADHRRLRSRQADQHDRIIAIVILTFKC